MAATTVALPFNLQVWIDQHLPRALGAIGNKEVFKGSDFIFQIIKGPNARNDFHLDPWDEIFYQIHGHVFLLPKNVYHSPRRPPGSIGLVIERPRQPGELDGMAWFCPSCSNKLHQV